MLALKQKGVACSRNDITNKTTYGGAGCGSGAGLGFKLDDGDSRLLGTRFLGVCERDLSIC